MATIHTVESLAAEYVSEFGTEPVTSGWLETASEGEMLPDVFAMALRNEIEICQRNITPVFVMLDENDEHSLRRVNTREQRAEVKEEMRQIGIGRLSVYRGDAPDTVKTDMILFAAEDPNAD